VTSMRAGSTTTSDQRPYTLLQAGRSTRTSCGARPSHKWSFASFALRPRSVRLSAKTYPQRSVPDRISCVNSEPSAGEALVPSQPGARCRYRARRRADHRRLR
jgi:hypothetical protein